jgi:hypothetical protein
MWHSGTEIVPAKATAAIGFWNILRGQARQACPKDDVIFKNLLTTIERSLYDTQSALETGLKSPFLIKDKINY